PRNTPKRLKDFTGTFARKCKDDGGATRNRTGVHGFAIRCITTLPLRPRTPAAVLQVALQARLFQLVFLSVVWLLLLHPRFAHISFVLGAKKPSPLLYTTAQALVISLGLYLLTLNLICAGDG